MTCENLSVSTCTCLPWDGHGQNNESNYSTGEYTTGHLQLFFFAMTHMRKKRFIENQSIDVPFTKTGEEFSTLTALLFCHNKIDELHKRKMLLEEFLNIARKEPLKNLNNSSFEVT